MKCSNNFISIIVLDDLNDAKNQLSDMNRRLHELELELRRLENEREELAAAYKEAEAVSGSVFISGFSKFSNFLKYTSLIIIDWFLSVLES